MTENQPNADGPKLTSRPHADQQTHAARLAGVLDSVRNRSLRTLVVEPSASCNLKCTFCDLHSGRTPGVDAFKGVMTPELFERLLAQVQASGFRLKLLQYIGHGEPLMNRHLASFVRQARAAGICDSQKIISNGTLLTRERLEELVDSGIECVEVSLDVADPCRYRAIKGADRYEAVHRNLCAAIEFAAKADRFDLIIKTATPHPDGTYGVEAGDVEGVLRTFGEIAASSPRVSIRGVPLVTFSDAMAARGQEYRSSCEIPFYMLMVLFDGQVVACCSDALRQLPVGDINTQELRDIVAGAPLRHIRLCHLDKRQEEIPLCLYCSNRPSVDLTPIADEIRALL